MAIVQVQVLLHTCGLLDICQFVFAVVAILEVKKKKRFDVFTIYEFCYISIISVYGVLLIVIGAVKTTVTVIVAYPKSSLGLDHLRTTNDHPLGSSPFSGKSSESVQLAMLKACDACADMGQ